MKLKIILALAAIPVVLLAACGDDDDDGENPEIGRVGTASENAAVAYGDEGAEGLYEFLSADISEACTAEEVAEALSDESPVTGWRNTSDIEMDGDDRATATVIMITVEGDEDQDWSFVLEDGAWRVSAIPGLEECTG